jgi:DNA-binding PadR family transcriptional regulator
MSPTDRSPQLRRPVSATVLHILLALADGHRHGYAIKQEAERRADGAVRLGPGTLYETLERLLHAGLVREVRGGTGPVNGQEAQRRYYELTPAGRRLLQQEIARLGKLVDYARSKPELA